MDAPFPFGLPLPTAFYLTAYVLTLVIHVGFMNYVLAGTGALAWAYWRPGRAGVGPMTALLRDWMPLMLSGAITAGVAPLLFLQILYKREYYTANLLLFNRWMAILPVLIIGFYALYLLKSKWLARRGRWLAAGVALVPAASVAFTGYSWTENHLLSVRTLEFWGEFYARGGQVYVEPQLLPRLAVWAVGSVPTLVVILAWQLWYHGHAEARALTPTALASLLLVGAAAAWYYLATDDATRTAFVSPMALPYFGAAIGGVIVQGVGWAWLHVSNRLTWRSLLVPTAGLTVTLIGMTVCREVVRITALGSERFGALVPLHAEAFAKGGVGVFLLFFAVNALLCGWVVWIARHAIKLKD